MKPNKFDNLIESNFNRSGFVTPLKINTIVNDDLQKYNTIGDKHLDTILNEFKALDCGETKPEKLSKECKEL